MAKLWQNGKKKSEQKIYTKRSWNNVFSQDTNPLLLVELLMNAMLLTSFNH
jgi:hypothetical protein